tara:strand:- start:668 stop:1621 length:954 start_codon:yes stop_codon:yes gene_type:complete
MYGGKSTYENGGIQRRPPRPVRPNYVPNPRENSEVGKGLSAKEMRRHRIMTDPIFDEKAKSGDYTPQTVKRRFVESLKPQTVIDKEKASKNKESDKDKYRKYIDRTKKMEDGGYLDYQKPDEYKDITLRPSEIPMFSIPKNYSDLDKGTRRERRTERYTKKYKKLMDKAYKKAAKERAGDLEDMESMNERQKRRHQRRTSRQEKRYSRKQTRRERRAERKGYGHPDDYLHGEGSKMGKFSGNTSGDFYIDPNTGEQMFKTRKYKPKKDPEGNKEGYGIIEERNSNRTKRREARFNRRQNRKWDRKQSREKRRQRKYI